MELSVCSRSLSVALLSLDVSLSFSLTHAHTLKPLRAVTGLPDAG